MIRKDKKMMMIMLMDKNDNDGVDGLGTFLLAQSIYFIFWLTRMIFMAR